MVIHFKPTVSFKKALFLLYILHFALCALNSSMAQEVLTLQKAIETGLQNNYSIILQRDQAKIASNNNTIGNAGFLPSLGVNVNQNNTISTTHQEQFSGTVKDVSGAMNNTLNVGLQLAWTVFDGMNMFANKRMLEVLEDLGQNGTRIVLEGTISDITLTYYGIIQLRKLVRVAQDAVDLSMQRKKIAEAKLSIGAGSQLMLLQSTVDLNADSTRLLEQQVALLNLHADLNQLLGRDPTTPFLIDDTISISPLNSYDTLLKLGFAQSPQLIAARLNQQLAVAGVRQAQSERYPQLGINAGYSYNTLNSATGFVAYNQSYGPSFGFSLSYTLFNGFNVTRAIRNAKVLVHSSDTEAAASELSFRTSILKMYQQFRSNLAVVKLQLSNVGVAQENVTIAFEKYKIGSINDIELREIQQKLIDAEYQLIYAQFEAKKAEVEILRLTGQLTMDNGQLTMEN